MTEFLKQETHIHRVNQEEEPVTAMIDEGVSSFDPNLTGPTKYLEMYEDYMYIMNGEAEKSLDNFFATEPFPYLKVSARFSYSA